MSTPEKPGKLLARLALLDDSERLAGMARHALGLDEEGAARLLAELAEGGVRERRLGLLAAAARRDVAHLWRGLQDPSLGVRRTAAGLVGRLADSFPDGVVETLDEVTLGTLTAAVVRHRRPTAPSLLTGLLARGRIPEAARLLSVCPPDVIEQHLPTVAWPATLWLRLAKHAPEVAARAAEQAFADSSRPDLVWDRFGSSFWSALATTRPERLGDLVDRHADPQGLPRALHAAITPLARAMPARVVGWLSSRIPTVSYALLPPALVRRLRTLEDVTLQPLCTGLARRDPALLAHWLSGLPPARRGSLFDVAIAELSTERTTWPTALLEVLPEPVRDREAARMLTLDGAKTDAGWRRTLLGFRAIEHARVLLEQDCANARAEDRQQAYDALIRSTGRSRRGMAETLGFLRRTRNEQDPVRMSVLGALAGVPVRLFDDAAPLDAVVAPVFDARDTSHATRSYASQLAHRLLVAHASRPSSPMFALGLSLLERLAGHSGTFDLPPLHPNLPRGGETAIVKALWPWLTVSLGREQSQVLFSLWWALGRRAWRVPELGQLLERIAKKGPRSAAVPAAQLWLEDPRHRDERVRALLRRDASAIYLHTITMHCHHRRQSLLASRFDAKMHRGRFHEGRVVPVPTFPGGFLRWTDALEAKYVVLLRSALAEPQRFATERSLLIHALGRLPSVSVAETMAAVRDGDIVETESALGALVWNDDPAPALAILLQHLDGDRARVAAYALSRLARVLPAAPMIEALAAVLGRPTLRVTVHKEMIRLLGRYPTSAAAARLREEWQKPLHRDVRIAALHAARSMLSEPVAWEILSAASRDPSPDVARALVDVHAPNVPEVYQAGYLRLMATVTDHGDPTVRKALFQALRSWVAAAPDEITDLSARVLERIDPLDPWHDAVELLADGSLSRATHDRLVQCAERLRHAAEQDVEPAGERDQLPRRRLSALVGRLESMHRATHVLAALDLLGLALVPSPTLWHLGAAARVAAVANEGLGATVSSLVEAAPDPSRALTLAAPLGRAARREARQWTHRESTAIVDALLEGGVVHRRLAVALVAGWGPTWGWGDDWTARLARLRHDDDVGVRTEALEVLVGSTS